MCVPILTFEGRIVSNVHNLYGFTKFNNYILYTDMFGAFYLNNILCEGEEKNIIVLVICDHNTVYLKL